MAQKKTFKIYEKRHASGNVGYRVDLGLVHGKRRFKSFSLRAEAESFRNRHLEKEAQKHPNVLADLDEVSRHEVLGALAKLRGHRASLNEAVDFFLKHSRPPKIGATIQQVIDEFKSTKGKAGLSEKYLKTSDDSFFRPFCVHFKNREVTEVTGAECERYIFRQKKWSVTTKATHIRHLSVLFNFALKKGFVTLNPFANVQRPKRAGNTAKGRVVSPENIIKILQYAKSHHYEAECAALVLVLFCGVRSEEVTHLTWEDIKLDEKNPVVVLDRTKANQRRVNRIPSNAVAWLKLLRGTGQITAKNHEGRLKYLRKVSGASFKQNSARICFASYHIARWEQPQQTSLLLGHKNPTLLWNTYRAMVSQEDAKVYWKISPDYTGPNQVIEAVGSETASRKRFERIGSRLNKP